MNHSPKKKGDGYRRWCWRSATFLFARFYLCTTRRAKKKKISSCSLELCLSLLWGIASPSNGFGLFSNDGGMSKTRKKWVVFFSSHSALILIFFFSLSLSLSSLRGFLNRFRFVAFLFLSFHVFWGHIRRWRAFLLRFFLSKPQLTLYLPTFFFSYLFPLYFVVFFFLFVFLFFFFW